MGGHHHRRGGRTPRVTALYGTHGLQGFPISTAMKREPPAVATSSSTDLRPALWASAMVFCTSCGVRTLLLLTDITTSPGCKPLSAASLSGSTLVISSPCWLSSRL